MEELFYRLLHAEHEDEVAQILTAAGLMDEASWLPLGLMENNFGIVGNQQDDPSAALIEKLINGIDSVLMLEAFKRGIDPEGSSAPTDMTSAVEEFFGVRDGRLENLGARERTALADRVQLVATGSRSEPCYLIIDKGEGQTPSSFPNTFLSLARSNKTRIPFVQGRFGQGGTGVLQFCGNRNYQLIVSRRAPEAPVPSADNTGALWGFTLVRRLLPGDDRPNSMYVYLAPSGRVPSFSATSIRVLPGEAEGRQTPAAYGRNLESGTALKLYNYQWRGRPLATTEARFEVERILHQPCLPVRITETRAGYRANYFATTVAGVWVGILGDDEATRVEEGFPAYGEVNIPGVGSLPYSIVVFKDEVDTRRVPTGVSFALNGQVHGALPRDYTVRELKLDYLSRHLFVSVDCTNMDARAREDFIMASRDRLRRNEVRQRISDALEESLSDHPGLQELNARRRVERIKKALEDETASVEAFQDLIRSDPSLASLFGAGLRLVTSIGPTTSPPQYGGRRFPSFFRISREPAGGLVKACPVNWKCRVDFETDAANDYFNRAESPGTFAITPDDVLESQRLWNGRWITYFRPPQAMQPGQELVVRVEVMDDDRAARGPFVNQFTLRAEAERDHSPGGDPQPDPPGQGTNRSTAPQLSIPNVYEVRRDDWAAHEMDDTDAIRIQAAPNDEGYDFYVNMDNIFLINEIRRNRTEDPRILEYWFKYGLALVAASMLALPTLKHREVADVGRETIENLLSGLARVMVPVIRRLHEGPRDARPDAIAAV